MPPCVPPPDEFPFITITPAAAATTTTPAAVHRMMFLFFMILYAPFLIILAIFSFFNVIANNIKVICEHFVRKFSGICEDSFTDGIFMLYLKVERNAAFRAL